jgi:hypothetical protein
VIHHLAAVVTVRVYLLRERLEMLANKEKDAGSTTETVIIVAALALLAIAVVTIIANKIMNKVNGINLGMGM